MATVQAMDMSNRYDSDPVRYSAAYPTGAEHYREISLTKYCGGKGECGE